MGNSKIFLILFFGSLWHFLISYLCFFLQITTELYEADLEKALILSKLEFEQKQVTTRDINVFKEAFIKLDPVSAVSLTVYVLTGDYIIAVTQLNIAFSTS